MVWTRRVAITLLALTVVMSQAITAAAAPGKGADQAQGKGGAKVEAKVETATEATEGEEAELPECEPAETDETLPAEGDESTTPAEGEEPAPAEGEEPAPVEGEEPAPVEGEEPAPVEGEEPAPCKEPASGKNMNGRGKSAQHNPNVNADGILVPGTAATMTQEQKEAKIAEVKAESRSMAKADRAKGEQGQYLVYVNGERLNLTPVAKNGRTLVPFRKLAEFLGATVDWEPNTRTVIMVKGETKVEIAIGAETALINGEEVPVQVAAELIGSSTFVPLRFIAEALGADVDYDTETGAITVITVGEGTEPAPTEPAPTEPAPTEPAPTEPAPTEPAPTDPAPTEPAPTEPAPTEPAPTEPAPTEPAPSEPAPTEPAPTEPAPTEPAPSEPAPSEPAPTEPAPTEPAPGN